MKYVVRMTAPGMKGAEYIDFGVGGGLAPFYDSALLLRTKAEAEWYIAEFKKEHPRLRDDVEFEIRGVDL